MSNIPPDTTSSVDPSSFQNLPTTTHLRTRMRVSIITALFFSLASFTHAQYYDVDFDARAIDDVLERREILDGLSTRELVNELSARLDDRLSRRGPDKKQPGKRGLGFRHDPVYKCPGCGRTFATEAEVSNDHIIPGLLVT
ncbi:hypothetical protein DFP72DRAFT_1180069 [Ephemerocybe angulata]|uniref:C2H2-type domain-containing protein n=1 Tax=Ephemerocybe angulata TaxID=980116 RepID=A0A8H6H8V7_9AGAR|nr:hypothetical protein DFP72DRAFT_1180069 [Tulosesus angulatus]